MRFPFSWWQTLWALLFISGLVFRARTAADINDSPVDGFALFRIACVFMIAFALFIRFCLTKPHWLTSLFSGLVCIFLVYPVISAISTTWSVRPPWTFYKSIEFLIDVCLLAVIVATLRSAEEYRKLVNWTWILLGLLVLSSWIGAIVDPGDALFSDPSGRIMPLPARLVGVVPVVSCNDLSEICAILALVALCRLLVDPRSTEQKGAVPAFVRRSHIDPHHHSNPWIVCSFLHRLSLLVDSDATLSFGCRFWNCLIVTGLSLALFTSVGTSVWSFLLRGQSVDEVSEISGRAEIWQESYYEILKHPWLGHGGFAGARFVVLSKNSINSSSLNNYIDGALDIGIAGPLILLIVLSAAGWILIKSIDSFDLARPDSLLALEMFIVLTVLLVRSVESSNLITHPMISFLAVLGAAEVLRQQKKFLPMKAAAYGTSVQWEGLT